MPELYENIFGEESDVIETPQFSVADNISETQALRLMDETPPAPEPNGLYKDPKLVSAALANDLLVLENPALTDKIHEARTMGFSDSEIAGSIRRRTQSLMLKKKPEEIDAEFGRTKETRQLVDMTLHKNGVDVARTVYHIDPKEAEKMQVVSERYGVSISDMRDPELRKTLYDLDDQLGNIFTGAWNGGKKEYVHNQKSDIDDQFISLLRGQNMSNLTPEQMEKINKLKEASLALDPQLQKLENAIATNGWAKWGRERTSLLMQQFLGAWEGVDKFLPYWGAAYATIDAAQRSMGLDRLAHDAAPFVGDYVLRIAPAFLALKPAMGASFMEGSFERARKGEQSNAYWYFKKNVPELDDAQAATLAFYVGVINGAIEVGNLGLVAKVIPGAAYVSRAWQKMLAPFAGNTARLLTIPTVTSRLVGFGWDYLKAVLTEAGEEFGQGGVRGFFAKVARRLVGAPMAKGWGGLGEALSASATEGWGDFKEALPSLAWGMVSPLNLFFAVSPVLYKNGTRAYQAVTHKKQPAAPAAETTTESAPQPTETEKARVAAAVEVLRDLRTGVPQSDVKAEPIDLNAPVDAGAQITRQVPDFAAADTTEEVGPVSKTKQPAEKTAEGVPQAEGMPLPKVVYVDAEKLDSFLQSLPEEQRVTIREALGWKTVHKTEGTRPEYALPRERFEKAVQAHQDLHQAVGRDTRLGVYGLTANEMVKAVNKAERAIRDPFNSEEPWAKEAQSIQEDVRLSLSEAGLPDEVAEKESDYWAHMLYGLANEINRDENGKVNPNGPWTPAALYKNQTIKKWIDDSIEKQAAEHEDRDGLTPDEALQKVEESGELPLYDDVGQGAVAAEDGMFTDLDDDDGLESYEQAKKRKEGKANILTKGNILSKGERPANLRTKPAPMKTGIGYKVFVLKNVNGVWGLYPAKIANSGNVSSALGVWIDAEAAPITGTTTTGRPFVDAGGAGADESSGTLAYRPGWHLGTIPYALQFNRGEKVPNEIGLRNKKGELYKFGKYFPNNFVWCEVEYADDVDYQEEATAEGFLPTGGFNPAYAGLKRLPVDGSYRYRTNPNPGTDEWVISGSMKVKRVLTRDEVDQIVEDAGRPAQLLEDGDILTQEIVDELNDRIAQNEAGGEVFYQDEVGGKEVDRSLDLGEEDRALWDEAVQGLSEYEKNKLTNSTTSTSIKNFLQYYSDLPSIDETVTLALAGRAKKGWYARSAVAIEKVFGKDSLRFTALLASLSPQCSVEDNFMNTLKVWMGWRKWAAENPEWQKMPYKKIRAAIIQIMKDNVQQPEGADQEKGTKDPITKQAYGPVLEAWVNNAVRSLITTDQSKIILSGPKVNSFMLNLRGDLSYVTNDTWMARFAGWLQRRFSGGMTFKGKGEDEYKKNPFIIPEGTDPGYQPGYLAMNALVRRAAKMLTNQTGENWEPGEVQETVWSWLKTYVDELRRLEKTWEEEYNNNGKDPAWLKVHPHPTIRSLIENNAITDSDIGATVDFAQLLVNGDKKNNYGDILRGDDEYAQRIEKIKDELGERAADGSGSTDDGGHADGVSGRNDTADGRREALLAIADRLDAWHRLELKHGAAKDVRKKYAAALQWRYSGLGDENISRPYQRASRGHDRSVRFLPVTITLKDGTALEVSAEELTPQADVVSNLERGGMAAPVFYALDMDDERSIPAFIEAFRRGKESQGAYGDCVTLKSPEEYAGHKLYLTEGGRAGFAISPGGDIVSAFSVKGLPPLINGVEAGANRFGQKYGSGEAMLLLAVQEGGRHLDCYDTILPRLYSIMGFKAVSRCAFDGTYVLGWNYELFAPFNNGRPDVVFMVYEPDVDKNQPYMAFDGKMTANYDEAAAAANDAIYSQTVKAGDLKTAQEMVNEAAKESGFAKGMESTLSVKDAHLGDGSVIDMAGAIFDKTKKGVTAPRKSKDLTNAWVGIERDGKVIGRVLLGEPKELKKGTAIYKSSLIAGTDQDLKDGEKRYYYPIRKRMDMRTDPRPVKRGKYQLRSLEPAIYNDQGTLMSLAKRFDPETPVGPLAQSFNQGPLDASIGDTEHGYGIAVNEKGQLVGGNNRYEQSAWHGTGENTVIERFSREKSNSGAGGNAHGAGALYAAQDRQVAAGYREEMSNTEYRFTKDGQEISPELAGALSRRLQALQEVVANGVTLDEDKGIQHDLAGVQKVAKDTRAGKTFMARLIDQYQALLDRIDADPEMTPQDFYNLMKEAPFRNDDMAPSNIADAYHAATQNAIRAGKPAATIEDVRHVIEEGLLPNKLWRDELYADAELLANADLTGIRAEARQTGALYEVEIPENDVLLDEQLKFSAQPKVVKDGIRAAFEKLTHEQKRDFAENILPWSEAKDEVFQSKASYIKTLLDYLNKPVDYINGLFKDISDPRAIPPKVLNARSVLKNYFGYADAQLDAFSATRKAAMAEAEKAIADVDETRARLQEQYEKEHAAETAREEEFFKKGLFTKLRNSRTIEGRDIYDAFAYALRGDNFENQMAASLALSDAGIKGITYDGAQDGRCFVIFDEDAIEIVNRYLQQRHQQGQQQPRGRITFTENGRSIIELFSTADASTFIHESGHLLLKLLIDFGSGKDAAPMMAKDLAVVLDFLGVKDASEITREHHEKFARTLELYMMEGKAPTSYLKQVFAKMKRWLLSIYHTAKALDTEITPEIRDLFDRLLAGPEATTEGGSVSLADLQADSVATEVRIEALEKQDSTEGEGDVPFLRVIAAQKRSTILDDGDIPDWVPPTIMSGLDKDEVAQRPALVEAIRKLGGIDYDSLTTVWGEGEAKALRARDRSLFTKDGRAFDTLLPDLEAEGIAVEDVQDLYDRLMKEDPRIDKDLDVAITDETLPWLFYLLGDDEVRRYAASRMRKLNKEIQSLQNSEDFETLRSRGPEIYKEQDLIREVLSALKRPRQEKAVSESDDSAFIGKDVDMSFEPPQGEVTHESIPTQQAADRAAGLLREDELISLREADRYAWRRAQRESRKAFLAGKKEATELGKERIAQLRNEWRARVAEKEERRKQRIADLRARQKERAALKKEIAKIVKRIEKARKQKNIIWAARQEIEELLRQYTLKNPSPERMAQAQFLYDYLVDHPNGPVRFEDYSSADQEAIRMLGTTMLPDMTMDELRELDAKVQEIRDRGREEYERWKAEKAQRWKSIFDECFHALGKIPGDDKVIRGPQDLRKEYKGLKGKLEKAKDWAYAATLGSHRLMDWIGNGNGKFDSPWTKWFIEKVNKCHDEYLRNANDRRERVEAALRENGLTMHDLSESRIIDGQQYTVDEMLSFYALMKNEKGMKALIFGNLKALRDPESHVAHVIQALTPEERNVADAVLEDYETSFDRLNKRFIEVYNDAMVKEENYSPLKRLEYTMEDKVIDAEDADAFAGRTAMQGAASMISSLEKGFTIRRMEISEKHQQPVDLGLLSIWNEQVTAHEHTAAFAELAGDLTAALYRRDEDTGTSMAKAIRLTKGSEAWQSVVGYTNLVIMNEQRAAHNVLNSVASTLGRRMTMVYLAGSISSALKQVASIPRFVMSAGLGDLLSACGQYMADPKGFMAEAYRLDPQIKERLPNAFYKLTQIDPTTAGKWSYRYDEAMKILMTPFSYMDRVAAAIGWRATYNRSIKDGLSQEKAYLAAQRAVALTQQVPNIKDMPAFWRQSGLAKLMMIFSSNNVPIWGMTAYDMAQAIKRGDVPETLKVMLALSIAATAMAVVTSGPPSGDDDDSWEEWIARAFTEQTIQSIPIVGKELVAAYDELINRNRRGSTYSALVTPIVKTYQGLQRMMADDSDKTMSSGLSKFETGAWQAAEGLSLLLAGAPITMARRLRTALTADNPEEALQVMLAMRRKQK